jgi:hypothetical protein
LFPLDELYVIAHSHGASCANATRTRSNTKIANTPSTVSSGTPQAPPEFSCHKQAGEFTNADMSARARRNAG